MATLKTIRKRIGSVKSTQKITKAMKMVAAAKLRRAQQAVVAARPYALGLKNVLESIASRADSSTHPLFRVKENPKKASFLVFTSNRGLCGGFNSNLLRKIETYLRKASQNLEVIDVNVIGKKGRDFFNARKRPLKDVLLPLAESFPFEEALQMAGAMIEGYKEGRYDEYYLVYNQFKSALSQSVEIEKVLPLSVGAKPAAPVQVNQIDYLYEPSRREVIDSTIPNYVATQLFRAHLESVASELGARMTAMENATKNASEMISLLTLQYNRVRQASITKELMDIVNGAEAIK